MAVVPAREMAAHFEGFNRLPAGQKLGWLAALAAAAAIAAGTWMWSQQPDWRVLYANVSDRDGGAIIGSLQQMNVPYRFADGGGAILVPATHVHEARMRLASQGLPKGGNVGFELMEAQKLGTSQFLEQVNYQRALEGELARSIQSLAAVQGARVHLAIAKQSVFVREQQKPSASVLLQLHPGRAVDPAQVAAIVNLVSSSIPELSPKSVTVVDQNGTLLTSQNERAPGHGLDATQLRYVQELEQATVRRIEGILEPIAGPGNVRAQVSAEVDFSQTEQVAETHKPNQNPADAAVRSQQTSESRNADGLSAAGVPGALSNQPPGPATAPVTGAPAPATGTPAPAQGGAAAAAAGTGTATGAANSRRENTVNYEVDKTIRHVRQPLGGLKRLSVAVVVNNRKEVGADGKPVVRPLSEKELAQISDLVKEAMGYSKERGDSLNVVNSPFTAPEKEAIPEVPIWKNPATWSTAKEVGKNLAVGGLLLFLVLGVLRPALRSLAQAREGRLAAEGADTDVRIGQDEVRAGADRLDNLQRTRQIAKEDPKLVATVVKGWVSGNE